MIRNKYTYLCLVAACAAIAAVIALTAAPSGKSGTPFPFTSVSAAQLASGGITLSSTTAAIPADAASTSTVAQAATAYEGAAVREMHYMHCVDTWARPQINQDCYAVSMDPSGVVVLGSPNMPPPKPATWEIELVDPTTAKVIGDRGGNN